MQDPNWRELLRFCFARGAYRGAGAGLLRNLTRGAEADNGSLFGVAEQQDGMLAVLRALCTWTAIQQAGQCMAL